MSHGETTPELSEKKVCVQRETTSNNWMARIGGHLHLYIIVSNFTIFTVDFLEMRIEGRDQIGRVQESRIVKEFEINNWGCGGGFDSW